MLGHLYQHDKFVQTFMKNEQTLVEIHTVVYISAHIPNCYFMFWTHVHNYTCDVTGRFIAEESPVRDSG